MSSPRFTSVADYLASLDRAKAETLRRIIDFILAEFPELEAKIAWNVPQIHRDGDYVFGFSAHKNHLTLAPWSVDVMSAFADRLTNYVVLKNCFHIPIDWKIDTRLIRELVRARLRELE